MGRLAEQHLGPVGPAGGVQIRRQYAYDKAGQLTRIGDSRRGQIDYRYDPVGRLLQAHSALGQENFAFDPAGNISQPQQRCHRCASP